MSTDLNNPTALRLLTTAERLFAEESIDGVSNRRISAEAGQRNNSALQYHFESREALLEAILEYRQSPLNQRRLGLLADLQRRGLQGDVRALVEAMVLPYVELLSGPPEASYYMSLVSQLYSQQRLQVLFPEGRERTRSLFQVTGLMRRYFGDMDNEEVEQRLNLLGLTLNHSVARWAHERRAQPATWPMARVQRQAGILVAFMVGGLQEPRVPAGSWLLAVEN